MRLSLPRAFMSARLAIASVLALASTQAATADDPQITARRLLEREHIGGIENVMIALSPQRDAAAFQSFIRNVDENTTVSRWHVLELDGRGALRSVGDGGDLILNLRQRQVGNGGVKAAAARWSPDGRWIAYARKADGGIQIWRSSRDGRVQEQVTRNAADVLGDTLHQALFAWSTDGSKIYYEVARPRDAMARAMAEEGERGYLYDERFAPGVVYGPLWIRCGASRAGRAPTASQACEPTLWTHDLAAGEDRLATDDERREYDALRNVVDQRLLDRIETSHLFQADDGSAVWLENVDPQTYEGYRPPLRVMTQRPGADVSACEAQACTSQFIEGVWKVGDEIIFQRAVGAERLEAPGLQAFYAWRPDADPRGERVRLIVKAEAAFEACDAAIDAVICVQEAAASPRRLVSIDPATGAITTLYDPNPDLNPDAFTRIEHLERTSADGHPGFAKLVFPRAYQAGERYPLVITQAATTQFLDGGAGGEYPVHLFANKGFFVLNVSGYWNYDDTARLRGADWAAANARHEDSALTLETMRDFIADLDARGLIDPNRVAVTGLSAQSNDARYALINSDLFAAAALSTGYSGPQSYWFSTSAEFRRDWSERYAGGALPFEPAAEARYALTDLGWHTREKRFPPVLWQVTDGEMSHALFDHALLQDEGHPVEMVVFTDENHVKYQPAHKHAVYRRNLQWMQFWLQGETVADPVDPAQYDRWRALCAAYVEGLRASDVETDHARAERQPCLRVADPSAER